jgi:hypothetical protein
MHVVNSAFCLEFVMKLTQMELNEYAVLIEWYFPIIHDFSFNKVPSISEQIN